MDILLHGAVAVTCKMRTCGPSTVKLRAKICGP